MDPQDAEAARVIDGYARGFMVSQVLFAACELGVFDALAAAPGPLSAEALAARLGCSASGTGRLLAACAALGLLDWDPDAGAFACTPLSAAYLTSGSPRSQRPMLLYLSRSPYALWAQLPHAVREGRNQHLRAFGTPAHDLFAAIYRAEDERLSFLRALRATWRLEGRAVLTAFDLSPFRVVCDLGGGSGALARACASVYPGCTVTVFEAPGVVRAARALRAEEAEAEDVERRVAFREGDFFRDPLPEADLYVLARVLHDWDDARCLRLLTRVRRACRPGGGALVVEARLDEGGRGPLPALLASLTMLLQTEGRERPASDLRALCARAGFRRARDAPGGGAYGAVLALK
ncbi:acetylserotonin O-methyltransferase [Perognathus longimembris pacificus]|uniref:acetylserotonin O-methyltransferase n=1 Tax=Perognathus longimembris pacificus TaxID=214514 RepID=UPI002019E9B2|nr:acetylserotonin O-methyltransferase [Perognathus longimembris pacificus]